MRIKFAFLYLALFALPSLSYSQNGEFSSWEERQSLSLNKTEITASYGTLTSPYIPGKYYIESFEGEIFPPAGWQSISLEGEDLYNYIWLADDSHSHSGDYGAFKRYNSTPETDWLISPRYTAESGDSLVFFIYPSSVKYVTWDSMLVAVSTEDSVPSGRDSLEMVFSDTLFVIPVDTLEQKWYKYSVSLDKYAGEKIYIGFKEYNLFGADLYLDDVKLGRKYYNDIAVYSAKKTLNDVRQGLKLKPKGDFRNEGILSQTFDAVLEIAPVNYVSRKTVSNLAPDSAIIVSFDDWLPEAQGTFTFKIYADMSSDEDITNNEYKKEVIISKKVYVPSEWHLETGLPFDLTDHGAVYYSKKSPGLSGADTGYIYIMGGKELSSSAITSDTIYKYNTIAKEWSYEGKMPQPLWRINPVQINGKIYMPGGLDSNSATQTSMHIYDIESQSFTEGADMPIAARYSETAAYGDSLIYVFGGTGSYDKVQIYSINTNTWKSGTPLPNGGAYSISGAIAGNDIVITGFLHSADLDSNNLKIVYYGKINPDDPYQIAWALGSYPGQSRYGEAAGSWYGKNKKFVFFTGGYDNYMQPLSGTWAYNLDTKEWLSPPDKTFPSTGCSALLPVVRNDSVYMAAVGGEDNYMHQMFNEWLFIGIDEPLIGIEEEPNSPAPVLYSLSQNYPNPFNPSTTIKYSIAEAGNVELKIYNMLGQDIKTLVNEMKSAGRHEVKFNAAGMNLSSGVYIYRIKSGSFVQTKKLMLIK